MSSASSPLRATACILIAFIAVPAYAAVDPALLFAKKWASRAYGQGDNVAPDLTGVTSLRSRIWLATQIGSPERTIKNGDPTAVARFKKHMGERMPASTLSAVEFDALIGETAATGPAASEEPRTHPTSATPSEVARGLEIFIGTVRMKNHGASCASCHMVREFIAARRATYGGDLTHIYSRFQDSGLTALLKHPCFPGAFGKDGAPLLTEDEASSIQAFLRQVDRDAALALALK
jgi:hypothetical protein